MLNQRIPFRQHSYTTHEKRISRSSLSHDRMDIRKRSREVVIEQQL
jgi:hypothetical protein